MKNAETDEPYYSKPEVKLIGLDGNVFVIIGRCEQALNRSGQALRAKEFISKAFNAGSYDAVLQLAVEYCEVS